MKVLINCSNLHGGGSVAIATSFISYLVKNNPSPNLKISILSSTVVNENLKHNKVDLDFFEKVTIKDFFGVRSIWQGIDVFFNGYDLIFTVMGPAYFIFKRTKHIFGFAHPWIIYPNNLAEKKLPLLNRLFQRIKSKLLIFFFLRADELIVELEHVKTGLRRIPAFHKTPIHIVYSEVDEVFTTPNSWVPVLFPDTFGEYKIGVISRNYPHKNLSILPLIKKRVEEKFNINLSVFVTFSKFEWELTSTNFRSNIINVGPLYLSQCPSFYSAMDGVVFPTLLECFSAVPIEAMLMKKPLFASDLPFIKDVCGDNFEYFNPIDVENISDVIGNYFLLKSNKEIQIDKAYEYVKRFSKHGVRGSRYMEIINKAIMKIL